MVLLWQKGFHNFEAPSNAMSSDESFIHTWSQTWQNTTLLATCQRPEVPRHDLNVAWKTHDREDPAFLFRLTEAILVATALTDSIPIASRQQPSAPVALRG